LEFRQDFLHQKTRSSGLLHGVILGLAIFVELTDGQTYGETHNDRIYRTSTASRSKNTIIKDQYGTVTVL